MNLANKTLLVLGSGGLLGSEFLSHSYLHGWNVIAHGRHSTGSAKADLVNKTEVDFMLDSIRPDAILNLVGLTDVDRCELHPNEAYIVNVRTLENVVDWMQSADKPVHLVHISTDQVYDGVGPHLESDVVIKNYYAFSKYTAELVAKSVGGTVLRTNFFGKSRCGKRVSLSDWLFSSILANKKIQVFEDVMFSPLSMGTLCESISLVLVKGITGTYNLGSHSGLSKADFAYLFACELGLDSSMMSRCTTNDVDFLKTYRPKDMRLNVELFERVAGVTLPALSEEIKKVSKEY